MLKLQETLNAMPHLSSQNSSFVKAHEGQPVDDLLRAAESATVLMTSKVGCLLSMLLLNHLRRWKATSGAKP